MTLKGRWVVVGLVTFGFAACNGKHIYPSDSTDGGASGDETSSSSAGEPSDDDHDAGGEAPFQPTGGAAGLSGTSGTSGAATAGTGTSGSAGTNETAGSGGVSGTGAGGASGAGAGGVSGAGAGGMSGAGGKGGAGAGAGGTSGAGAGGMSGAGAGGGGMSGAGAGGMAGAGGSSGAGGGITSVWMSDGCTNGAGVSGNFLIHTMGTKDADCADHLKDGTKKCGAWSLDRKYKVILPDSYDKAKPPKVLLEGPGCGGNENSLYTSLNVGNTIRVGLAPPDPAIGHGTNPGEGCFDDKEGNDSVDWILYEALYDKLNTDYCFDRNRVFMGGNSSGSNMANELGCKYAGDAKRPVRGVLPNTGGLPMELAFVPTCTTAGMSGFWVHEKDDGVQPFSGNNVAIARAMKLAKCSGTGYDDAAKEDFPIGGGKAANTCQRITGCDPLFPLVVCLLTGTSHASHDDTVRPGWQTFLSLFDAPPLAP